MITEADKARLELIREYSYNEKLIMLASDADVIAWLADEIAHDPDCGPEQERTEDDWMREAMNREAQEMSLARPLFPNEH